MNIRRSALGVVLRLCAAEVVRELYRGLLLREADSGGLAAHSARLRKSPDLAALLREMSGSQEHWEQIFRSRAAELVEVAYRGLLKRDADPNALQGYAAALADTRDLQMLLATIARSDEHWIKTLETRAPDVVRALYAGLLDRDPDPEALQQRAEHLAATRDLSPLLENLAGSDEHWDRQLATRAPQLVQSLYRVLLKRDVDASGLQSYSKMILQPDGVGKVAARIVHSREFTGLDKQPIVVFLHIEKTAGTSMQGMLRDAFGRHAHLDHADRLAEIAASELANYSVIAGHFNHDSLKYIPGGRPVVFTFVREPKERLLSLYYFWRAHEPSAPHWTGDMKLANELLLEDFFARRDIGERTGIWNHMTWAIMGQRQWAEWRVALTAATGQAAADFIETTARPAIRARLREFAFVGLQGDYDRSVEMLCDVLGWPRFKQVRAEHSLEALTQSHPNFKRNVEQQPRTAQLDSLLDHFVQLDNVVYAEAEARYAEFLEKFGDAARSGGKSGDRNRHSTFCAADLRAQKLVFLHLPKTGGTTLQNLLRPHFDTQLTCPERFNGLRHYAAGELARYRYFAGHFDLPSVRLIPGRKQIITLLRDPVTRLASFYYFQRAHKPEAIERRNLELARLASTLTMAEFFRAPEVRSHRAINNAMTRLLTEAVEAVHLAGRAEGRVTTEGALASAPLALSELCSLDAFGLMERYDESVRLIFSTIGLTPPTSIEKKQVLDDIVNQYPGMRQIDKEPITDEIRELMHELVAADRELYQGAVRTFDGRIQALDGIVPK